MGKMKDIDTVIREEHIRKADIETDRLVKKYKTIEEQLAFIQGMMHQVDKSNKMFKNLCDTTQ